MSFTAVLKLAGLAFLYFLWGGQDGHLNRNCWKKQDRKQQPVSVSATPFLLGNHSRVIVAVTYLVSSFEATAKRYFRRYRCFLLIELY